jgi:hypothetical protein
MGFLDNLLGRIRRSAPDAKDKAQDLAAEHGDTVKGGVHKAADIADEKTGKKYSGQIDKAESAAEDAVDKLAGDKAEPPAGTPPAP